MSPISHHIRALVEEAFDEEFQTKVLDILGETQFPMVGVNLEQVHFGLIHLASGDFTEFMELVKGAQSDWRDVLYASGFAHQKWKGSLGQSGN